MFQSDKKRNALGTILGPDIEFSGDIKASGNIIIYGKITLLKKKNIKLALKQLKKIKKKFLN